MAGSDGAKKAAWIVKLLHDFRERHPDGRREVFVTIILL